MKIKILTVGKTSLKPTAVLTEEYRKRIQPYRKLESVALKRIGDFEKYLSPNSFLVVMEATGKMFSSERLAEWIADHEMRGTKEVCFLVGPGEGLPNSIKQKADLLLSLSPMTFQHELALVVLMEQLYRACTILKGEPYHKA